MYLRENPSLLSDPGAQEIQKKAISMIKGTEWYDILFPQPADPEFQKIKRKVEKQVDEYLSKTKTTTVVSERIQDLCEIWCDICDNPNRDKIDAIEKLIIDEVRAAGIGDWVKFQNTNDRKIVTLMVNGQMTRVIAEKVK